MYNPKYRKGQHKESKEFRRARAKASFHKKFDPTRAETTRDTQRRLKEEEDNNSDDDDSDDAAAINDIDDDTNDANDIEMTDPPTGNHKPTPDDKIPPYQSRIELLRAKLRAKLDAKRLAANNNKPSTTTTDGTNTDNSALISKRAARRAAKQKRIELAKRRNTGGSTQTGGYSKRPNGTGASGLTEEELGGSKVLSLSSTPSGDELLSGIDYGGIAGLKDDVGANYTKSNKSLMNMGKKKSLEHLLAVAAANREKLDKLKASADFEDKAKVKKVEWGKALKAARYVYLSRL